MYFAIGGLTTDKLQMMLNSVGLAIGSGQSLWGYSPTQALDVRGPGNFSGTVYIKNATDISLWSTNVSLNWTQLAINELSTNFTLYATNVSTNWTAVTFTDYNSTWNYIGIGNLISLNTTLINTSVTANNKTINAQALLNGTALNLNYLNVSTVVNSTNATFYNAMQLVSTTIPLVGRAGQLMRNSTGLFYCNSSLNWTKSSCRLK